MIATHIRSYECEDTCFDPVHYLPLLERKPAAFDQAAPLNDWNLSDQFNVFRNLIEQRLGKAGKREYIQILRLMEPFELAQVGMTKAADYTSLMQHHAKTQAVQLEGVS